MIRAVIRRVNLSPRVFDSSYVFTFISIFIDQLEVDRQLIYEDTLTDGNDQKDTFIEVNEKLK